MVTTALDVLQWLVGPGAGGPSSVGMGASKAIKNALTELHATEKTVENTDQLMVRFVLLFTTGHCHTLCWYQIGCLQDMHVLPLCINKRAPHMLLLTCINY